jgi:hypothetical protein
MRANFVKKACSIEAMKASINIGNGSLYIIEEIVEIEPAEYEKFTNNLLEDYDFIDEHKNVMYVDGEKVWHCVLVKAKGRRDGILVESEGASYARYTAYYPC